MCKVLISNINKTNNRVDQNCHMFGSEESAREYLKENGFDFVSGSAATKPYEGKSEHIKYVEALMF